MSIELMRQVFGLDIKGGRRDVLLHLADYARHDGKAWPSVRRIAWDAGLDRRHVQRILRDLEEEGLIEVLGRETGGRSNTRVYQLHLEKGVMKPPFESDPGGGGDNMSPFTGEPEEREETPALTRGITPVEVPAEVGGDNMSPFAERATSTRERAARARVKGDIAMPPEPLEPLEEKPSPKDDERSVVPATASHPPIEPQRTNEILAAALNDGIDYDRRFKGRLAREIKRLLGEGIHPRIVTKAAKRCTGHRKPDPGLMPSLIVEVQNESRGISGNGHRGHRPFDAADQDYRDSVIR